MRQMRIKIEKILSSREGRSEGRKTAAEEEVPGLLGRQSKSSKARNGRVQHIGGHQKKGLLSLKTEVNEPGGKKGDTRPWGGKMRSKGTSDREESRKRE